MSETTNNTDRIRAWLRTCPIIAKSKYFGADYIGENSTEYSVINIPSGLRYRENILGKKVLREKQEQQFTFAARVPYGRDVQQNLENITFFQDVVSWIQEQNKLENFPEWNSGIVYGIEAVNTGAPIRTDTAAAIYQFTIKVTYKVKENG